MASNSPAVVTPEKLSAGTRLDCKGRVLDLSRPAVMGVLNVTPDSFSDGGRFFDHEKAFRHAAKMVEEGAQIIDVGGESTRPWSQPVSLQQELERVLPVIERMARELDTAISIDSTKAGVMREAVAAGVGMINDINGLRGPGVLEEAARGGAAVCIMHMQGTPQTMQDAPYYDDVVGEISEFLQGQAMAAESAGVRRENIVLDPGFGFGKTVAHNLHLLAGLDQLAGLGYALLVGVSRKSMLRALLKVTPDERIYGGIAAAVLAVERGARIVRSHDVRATVEALRVVDAVGNPDGD
jgi:dihydropteroate synthase